jgi:hypothetical protein
MSLNTQGIGRSLFEKPFYQPQPMADGLSNFTMNRL